MRLGGDSWWGNVPGSGSLSNEVVSSRLSLNLLGRSGGWDCHSDCRLTMGRSLSWRWDSSGSLSWRWDGGGLSWWWDNSSLSWWNVALGGAWQVTDGGDNSDNTVLGEGGGGDQTSGFTSDTLVLLTRGDRQNGSLQLGNNVSDGGVVNSSVGSSQESGT